METDTITFTTRTVPRKDFFAFDYEFHTGFLAMACLMTYVKRLGKFPFGNIESNPSKEHGSENP